MSQATLIRTRHTLLPDPRRVITKPFLPGQEVLPGGASRVRKVLDRVLAIPEDRTGQLLEDVLSRFSSRHRDFEQVLDGDFERVARYLPAGVTPSPTRRRLIGAYFTHEFSVEAAALFNPSIVAAPDDLAAGPGEQRFVMSLRAVGEGHLSSIEFRSGTIDSRCNITFDPVSPYLGTGSRQAPAYRKKMFRAKLVELAVDNEVSELILDELPEEFTLRQLEDALSLLDGRFSPAIAYETTKMVHMFASSNYVVTFPEESTLTERLLFPTGPHESRGMEDARFVRFVDEDGSVAYYATYTAFDGYEILPQLIETSDFVTFRISTLSGPGAQNKGMALFPRRIGGRLAALSRRDRESNYLMFSDEIRSWEAGTLLQSPGEPWELVQIGNCGSPLETDAGWLVLTHGVGPMRCYAFGAMLLDLDNPARVIGHLRRPLLMPDEREREGYVPNVVYGCGGLIHGQNLVVPYGFADQGTAIAVIRLPELLDALLEDGEPSG